MAVGTNPAQSGAIRLANYQGIYSRNAGNTADYQIIVVDNGNSVILGESTAALVTQGTSININSSIVTYLSAGGTTYAQCNSNVFSLLGSVTFAIGTNPAQSGAVRLPNNQAIRWRNGANTADYSLVLNASNQVAVGGAAVIPDTTGAIDLGASGAKWRNVWVSSSVVNKVKAGTPVDADVVVPTDGMMVLDSTANKIWVRLGGVWKGVVVA